MHSLVYNHTVFIFKDKVTYYDELFSVYSLKEKQIGYSQSVVSGIMYLEAHQIPILAECPIAKC